MTTKYFFSNKNLFVIYGRNKKKNSSKENTNKTSSMYFFTIFLLLCYFFAFKPSVSIRNNNENKEKKMTFNILTIVVGFSFLQKKYSNYDKILQYSIKQWKKISNFFSKTSSILSKNFFFKEILQSGKIKINWTKKKRKNSWLTLQHHHHSIANNDDEKESRCSCTNHVNHFRPLFPIWSLFCSKRICYVKLVWCIFSLSISIYINHHHI